MFRPLELFVGLRYTRARRRNHFISFISLVSMLGIALGVTALITVLSVMNGFEKELRDRILGVVAHATILGTGEGVRDWPRIVKELGHYPQIKGAAPYIRGEGMLSHGPLVAGAMIRGILPAQEGQVSNVGKRMLVGRLDDLRPGRFGIILGKELAFSLGADVGDQVTLITPQANVTPLGVLPRLRRFTVVGVFEIGMFEYDSALALVNINDAARLFRMENRVSGVRLRLDDLFLAPQVSHQILRDLPADYQVSDWTHQHVNFFRAVKMEKTVMFIILLLIVAVAAFNLVSTLVMMVTDKESDIAILRTLGASPRSIMTVFIIQGGIIGFVGTSLGVAGGVVLALNIETLVPAIEHLFHVRFLSPEVYYITELPSDLRWADAFEIGGVAFLLSLLATVYPARRAARTRPAEALRYE